MSIVQGSRMLPEGEEITFIFPVEEMIELTPESRGVDG